MERKQLEIFVYGAEQVCPSCVSLPSSKETCDWLEAAISRKFPSQPFTLTYVDIFNPPSDSLKQQFSEKIIKEELFYPVVVIEGKVIAEGNPRLKVIFAEMTKYGYSETNK